MNVAALQTHLRDLAAFLSQAGAGATIVKDLTAVNEALTPFGPDGLSKFAEFLKAAEEYRRTGIIPGKGGKAKAGPSQPALQVEALQRQLGDLYERANAATDAEIDEVIKPLDHKDLGLDVLKLLARAVEAEGRVKSLRAKGKVIAAIRQAITDRRAMAQRGQQ